MGGNVWLRDVVSTVLIRQLDRLEVEPLSIERVIFLPVHLVYNSSFRILRRLVFPLVKSKTPSPTLPLHLPTPPSLGSGRPHAHSLVRSLT